MERGSDLQTGSEADIPDAHDFQIGPDRGEDIREARPYFLIPVDDDARCDAARERVVRWLRRRQAPITDVYVLCHGWHRNFFDAVAVYDRLLSRFAVLVRRGRIQPTPPYNPLYLAIHWHSDPGAESWWDMAGRRHKASFLQHAEAVFNAVPPPPGAPNAATFRFLADFEDLYEFMSFISAPGTDAFGADAAARAKRLVDAGGALKLDQYDVREAPRATQPEKIVLAWRCYHESQVQRTLTNQSEKPGHFFNLWTVLTTLVNFALAAGILAVLPSLLPKVWPIVERWIGRIPAPSGWEWQGRLTLLWLCALPASLLYLVIAGWMSAGASPDQDGRRQGKPAKGLPVLAFLAWVDAQLVFAAPALVTVMLTYLLGWINCHPGLSRERIGNPDESPVGHRIRPGLRYLLTYLARVPIRLVRGALAADSSLHGVVDTVDRQLAFYDMQIKGIETGPRAAVFLHKLRGDLEAGSDGAVIWPVDVRVHLVGHSFGGLVIANCARHLVLEHTWTAIQTVCTVQGALASAWFEKEHEVRRAITGLLAAVFTRYDTATGFYYPVGNDARIAMGSVGLYLTDRVPALGGKGEFASLASPPALALAPNERAANFDASRLCYQGPATAGGGHDDLFKDDVVNLLWAIMAR